MVALHYQSYSPGPVSCSFPDECGTEVVIEDVKLVSNRMQKMTTNQRANAAVEQYWSRRAPEVRTVAAMHSIGRSTPDAFYCPGQQKLHPREHKFSSRIYECFL